MNADGTQYGEFDAVIGPHFGDRKGHFLDIGAFNGVTLSNTLPLAARGWTGVLVEPDPIAFAQIVREYPYPDQVDMVNAAVYPTTHLRNFWMNTGDGMNSDMLSTLDSSHVERCAGHPFRKVWISPATWDDLLYPWGGSPFDFVNIDTESTNLVTLTEMPFRPEMLCIEIENGQNVEDRMHLILLDRGYRHFRRVGDNLLAWRDA